MKGKSYWVSRKSTDFTATQQRIQPTLAGKMVWKYAIWNSTSPPPSLTDYHAQSALGRVIIRL